MKLRTESPYAGLLGTDFAEMMAGGNDGDEDEASPAPMPAQRKQKPGKGLLRRGLGGILRQ